MFLRILIVVSLLVIVNGQSNANWSCYSINDELEPTFETRALQDIVVSQYFDIGDNKRKIGILAPANSDAHEEFFVNVDKRVEIEGKIEVFPNITVLDHGRTLYYWIGVLKNLISVVDILESKHSNLKSVRNRITSGFNDLRGILGGNYKSKRYLELLIKLKELEITYLSNDRKLEEMNFNHSLILESRALRRRIDLRNHYHNIFLNLSSEKISRIEYFDESGYATILSSILNEKDTILSEENVLQQEIISSFLSNKAVESAQHLELLKFKIEEKIKAENKKEVFFNEIIETKTSLLLESTENIISLVIQDLQQHVEYLLSNPWIMVYFGSISLLIIMTWVIFTEGSNLIGEFSQRQLIQRRIMKLQADKSRFLLTSTLKNLATVKIVDDRLELGIHSHEDRRLFGIDESSKPREKGECCNITALLGHATSSIGLEQLINMYRCSQSSPKKYSLPNILIQGPPGTGKSYLSHILACASGLSYAIITTGDLQASGRHRAAQHLKDVLRSSETSSRPVIFIIDGADALLSCRRIHDGSTDMAGDINPDFMDITAKECFYVLLNELRNESNVRSVIFTISIPLEKVDMAVMDRMDHLLQLSPPKILDRYQFCCIYCLENMNEILDLTARNEFQEYWNHFDQGAIQRIQKEWTGIADKLAVSSSTNIALSSLSLWLKNLLKVLPTLASWCSLLACCSEGWSYRELIKFLNTIRSVSMCSDKCRLTESIWIEHLMASFENHRNLMTSVNRS